MSVEAGDHKCVAAIVRGGDRVLLCHRRPEREWFPDVWDLPGGHLAADEPQGLALARELTEELGVLIDAPTGPPFVRLRDGGVELAIWLLDYDGPIENLAPDEHDEVRWFTAEELPTLRFADPVYLPMLLRALK